MTQDTILVAAYVLMTLVQTLHIFEEAGMGAYKMIGSMGKYLAAASAIISLNYLVLLLLLFDVSIGYYLAVIGGLTAVLNGVIHLAGLIKTGSYRDSIGAGVFSGIPLGIAGIIVLYMVALRVL